MPVKLVLAEAGNGHPDFSIPNLCGGGVVPARRGSFDLAQDGPFAETKGPRRRGETRHTFTIQTFLCHPEQREGSDFSAQERLLE